MARRSSGARLPEGKLLVDFASPARIRAAYENDERAIRAEYSRQRSIIRKRIERMEAAGETYNRTFQLYGDLKKALPSARGLTTDQMMKLMSGTAAQLGAGYQSTVRDVKAGRRAAQETLRAAAEAMGDDDLSEKLSKDLTPKQYAAVGRVMGMLKAFAPPGTIDTNEMWEATTLEVIKKGGSKRSLLAIANDVIGKLDLDVDISDVADKYTTRGTIRVSWSKAHGKRGK